MNKAQRTTLAKELVNKIVPQILNSDARARAGVKNTKLIRYGPAPNKKSLPQPSIPKISVIQSDTFDAAHTILTSLPPSTKSKVAILNMASPLQPGGGFIRGSLAQEESLCARSTLYAALTISPPASTFYRLPSLAAIYSPDILVFRSSDLKDLPKKDWYYVDVITAAAVRKPDLVETKAENGEKKCMYEDKDREEMLEKVKMLFWVAKEQGVTHLVLGAWGCGAYGNPTEEVAGIFKKVLLGDRRRESVTGFEEVVFAVFDKGENLSVFSEVFSGEKEDI
ncbi:hypothetical protein BGZ60DRAFT_370599 [Tricladium varicosporioides]|nr:hypothetical protein BGZ60DRAFT_370599 [Hymenoscyphus varicosporioides]